MVQGLCYAGYDCTVKVVRRRWLSVFSHPKCDYQCPFKEIVIMYTFAGF